jgi:hypothetical protein
MEDGNIRCLGVYDKLFSLSSNGWWVKLLNG